jgi:hypothetical protein
MTSGEIRHVDALDRVGRSPASAAAHADDEDGSGSRAQKRRCAIRRSMSPGSRRRSSCQSPATACRSAFHRDDAAAYCNRERSGQLRTRSRSRDERRACRRRLPAAADPRGFRNKPAHCGGRLGSADPAVTRPTRWRRCSGDAVPATSERYAAARAMGSPGPAASELATEPTYSRRKRGQTAGRRHARAECRQRRERGAETDGADQSGARIAA